MLFQPQIHIPGMTKHTVHRRLINFQSSEAANGRGVDGTDVLIHILQATDFSRSLF
jgi:hypothetical protein